MKKNTKTGLTSDQGDYKVSIKYSKKAIAEKLIKFTVGDKSFEISSDKLIELLAKYVGSEELSPVFVNTERINVVFVKRNIQAQLDRDFKAGEIINMEYQHPYPLEFALIEEAYKIAAVNQEREGVIVTPELLKQVKRDTPKQSEHFIKSFYKSFKNLMLGDSS